MLPANTLLLRGKDLDKGVKTGLIFEEAAVALAPGEVKGSLESPELALPRFTQLVASWNSTTSPGTFVELLVKVKRDGAWSRWFSYGKWSGNGANGGSIKGQQDEVARLETDLLRILSADGDAGGSGEAIRFSLKLSRDNVNLISPRVRLIAFTYAPKEAAPDNYTPAEIALKVAPRAQLPVPKIGNAICSPTSLATVMAYHGHTQATEQVAAGAKDNGAGIYGNWSYNVAYAAEKGFTAWVQRCNSMDDVTQYLQRGLPVIASVRTTAKEDLDGAIMAYPYGHLLVITGLAREGGQDYVLVNDPSAHRDEDVPRRYKLNQFLKAWSNKMIYVLQQSPI